MSRLALGGRPNQAPTVFPRTLTHPTDGTRPGGPGGPPLTAGTTIAPDSSVQPYHPNLPGGQVHNQIISSLGKPPGPQIQNGQYQTAIYNGVLPDFKIEEASGYMRRPLPSPAMSNVTGQQQGELSAQFQDLMRSKTMAGDIDLRRGAAEQQADLGLRRQVAMADSGLQGGNLMARMNEGQMAASLPLRNLLLQLLG
jgi:hypothetical protein